MKTASATAPQHIPQRIAPRVPDSNGRNQAFVSAVESPSPTPANPQLASTTQAPSSFLDTLGFLQFHNVADIGLRAPLRVLERSFVNPVTGTLFRLGSELLRHSTTNTIREASENRPINRGVLIKSAKSALGNTAGRIVFNTNNITPSGSKMIDSAKRAAIGFGNIIVQFAFRIALIALDYMDPGDIDSDVVFDEIGMKSLSRVVDASTGNFAIDTGAQIVQQGLIHWGLENTPFKSTVSGFISKLKGNPQSKQAQADPALVL